MPDPQRDIAPIIEPAAPPPAPSSPDYFLPTAVAVGVVLLFALLVWQWRRREPLRSLRRLAQEPDPIQAGTALATLAKHFAHAPPPDWQADLERLRFGPPDADAADLLARLCQQAESFIRPR